jgi:hypothetical protein
MTSPWTARPANLGAPGHANRGDEWEALLDQVEFLSGGFPAMMRYKTGDTSRSSATTGATYTDDPDLAVPVLANAVYVVELEANLTIGAGNFKQQWTWPAGGRLGAIAFAYNNGTVAFASSWQRLAATTTSPGGAVTGVSGGGAGGTPWRYKATLEVASTAGVLTWQWAQDASNAANTTVERGSWMRVTRCA